MIKNLILTGFLFSSVTAQALEIGDPAPAPPAIDHQGKDFDFSKAYQQGITLVYFYPKADTPGCTKQSCSLRDAYEELVEKGIQVIGVSKDSPSSQSKFREKYKLPFTLIADDENVVIDAFGVKKLPLGFASRQAYLIKEGKVAWLDRKASTKQQAQNVLTALKTL
ncbi:MAG: peroxiredoxin [Verrucomicrobiota bacterium]